jgi:Domain of unknown function (DU1801)
MRKKSFATPTEYIAAADEAKRADLAKLHRFIRAALPNHETCIVHGMIGYGPYHYRYASGREGDSVRVALASNKTGFSVYVSCVDEKGYLAEQAKARLGKASVGKSCIRFKRLADIELTVLGEVLSRARTATAIGDSTAVMPKAKVRP